MKRLWIGFALAMATVVSFSMSAAAGSGNNISRGNADGIFTVYTESCNLMTGCTTSPVIPINKVTYSASAAPVPGAPASGSAKFEDTLTNPNQTIYGTVTCLSVFETSSGLKLSTVGGYISGLKNILPSGYGGFNSFVIFGNDVDDNTGENSTASPDTISVIFLNTGGTNFFSTPCSAFNFGAAQQAVIKGDIEVEAASF
jgi:hypothetical protein